MDGLSAITSILSVSTEQDPDSLRNLREEDAHRQLEAVFISLMLKELRTAGADEGEGLFAGDKSDTFGGLFDMFLGEELARSGGIGMQALFRPPEPLTTDHSAVRRTALKAYSHAETR